MGFFKAPKTPTGPSPDELRQREEAARQAERDRFEREEADRKAKEEQDRLKAITEKESRRKAFAGQLAATEETGDERKRFLKGA